MKLLLSAVLVSSTQGFVPHSIPFCRDMKACVLRASTPNLEAIDEATRLSKLHGAGSKEARVAWDIVEEINASDNSASYTGGISEDDCFIGDIDINTEAPEECDDYVSGVNAIAESLKNQETKFDNARMIAESVQPIKLSDVTPEAPKDSPAQIASMVEALDNARRITNEQGIKSSAAKLAWEAVEEMGSNDLSEAMKKGLDPEECLVDKVQACEAMEELDRVMFLDKIAESGRYY